MSATQRIIDKLTADNVEIIQTALPEGADPNQFRDQALKAMAENNRKIGVLTGSTGSHGTF